MFISSLSGHLTTKGDKNTKENAEITRNPGSDCTNASQHQHDSFKSFMRKLIILGISVVLISAVVLSYRASHKLEKPPAHSISSAPNKINETQSGSQTDRVTTTGTSTQSEKASVVRGSLILERPEIRESAVRFLTKRYAEYFEKAQLSEKESELLFDILVDQNTSESTEDYDAYEEMLRTTLGTTGYKNLKDYQAYASKRDLAANAIKDISKVCSNISPESQRLIQEAITTYGVVGQSFLSAIRSAAVGGQVNKEQLIKDLQTDYEKQLMASGLPQKLSADELAAYNQWSTSYMNTLVQKAISVNAQPSRK